MIRHLLFFLAVVVIAAAGAGSAAYTHLLWKDNSFGLFTGADSRQGRTNAFVYATGTSTTACYGTGTTSVSCYGTGN